MYKKILVPYDSSRPSRHGLEQALGILAPDADAEITVLSVVDWHEYNVETFKIASRMAGVMGSNFNEDPASSKKIDEEAVEEQKKRVEDDIASIIDGNKAVKVAVINGSPHDAITDFADRGHYDCIVMGHRGMGAVRGMIGSVCYSVLHKTTVPVLVVK